MFWKLVLVFQLLLASCTATINNTNSSNSSNVTLCTTNIKGYSWYPQTMKCNCSLVEKYNCCEDISNAVYCSYSLTVGQAFGYKLFQWQMLLFGLVILCFAIYALRQDYQKQKEAHAKRARGKFRFKGMVRTQIFVLGIFYGFLTFLWSLDPHDGMPTLGVELYGIVFRDLLLRLPQWILCASTLLLILLWSDLTESARKLRKKSQKQREEDNRRRQLIVSSLSAFLCIIGLASTFMVDILPKFLYDQLTNLILTVCVVFLGMIGAPYYAYNVVKLLKTMKNKTAKKMVAKTGRIAKQFFTLSVVGIGIFVFYTFVYSTMDTKLVYYFGIHNALNIAQFLMIYASLPSNSNSKKVARAQNNATSTAASTAAETEMP